MTGLLVSVRSAAEAEIALAGGADVIDVKDPSRGSLGAADPAVWQEVCEVVGNRAPVSIALGELRDQEHAQDAPPGLPSSGVAYAKLGLAGESSQHDWMRRWGRVMSRLPAGVQPVAVAYADWRWSESPAPHEVLAAAAARPTHFLLVDTFDKSRGSLLDYVTIEELRDLSARAADVRIRLVLAGSLDEASIVRLLPLRPAYIAVRGAACGGQRTQAICAERVKRLATLVRTSIDRSCN